MRKILTEALDRYAWGSGRDSELTVVILESFALTVYTFKGVLGMFSDIFRNMVRQEMNTLQLVEKKWFSDRTSLSKSR